MTDKLNGSKFFNDNLTDNELEQISQMVGKFNRDENIELEVSFLNINYPSYIRISGYYIDQTDENDISSTESLDISILLSDGNTYRVSLLDSGEIQSFIKKFSKSNTSQIQSYLLGLKPDDNHEIILKNRGAGHRLHVKDLGLVFKATSETGIKDKIKLSGAEKMTYRYKARSSFVIGEGIRLDVTDVQQSNFLHNLMGRPSVYEIELEFTDRKVSVDKLFDETVKVLAIVQDSSVPVGRTEALDVVHQYQKLVNSKTQSHLESRNVISIEAQHIVKFIPNKYSVTDKADGERYFMMIFETGIYLVSTNMVIRKTHLHLKSSAKKYYNTVLDGEFLRTDNNKEIYLAFDVVYSQGIDYRRDDRYNLPERLGVLDDIINECFGTLIQFTDYATNHKDMDLELIKKFYTGEIKEYWRRFNKALDKVDGLFVARKKYFVPYGIEPGEVFMYADLLWKLCVYEKLPPYKLDGIIYTPINAPYMISASPDKLDTVPLEYKWKNPSQNSIDFFIKFEKDPDGSETIFYDGSVTHGQGKPYKICTLFVGINKDGQEKPIPFKVNGVVQKANIYLVDDEARDISGAIIDDSTVVEFIYDNLKTDMEDGYKWIPIKIRYDKTESVQKFGRKFGNNLNIAIRIWKTILNPITEEIIASLGNPNTYDKEMDRLSKSGPGREQSFAYYQKKTSDANGMRAFNNWIKSNMILTYCSGKNSVLDIGCGRGGDLIKFINAGVGEYVGLDIDNNGLYVINESAFGRYKNLKKRMKNVPPMYFIQADARGLFDVSHQENILPKMNNHNKELIQTHLASGKKYDIINCQFTLHYYLSDELSWSNFCQNISNCINTNGYLLITCFDGKLLYDKLKNRQKMEISYTDTSGKKVVFSEIVKIYDDRDEKTGIGMGIDVYNSIIFNPGTYIREYLVFPEFLQKSLEEKCGLELVETDSFYNLFNLYKNYFVNESSDKLSLIDTSAKQYTAIRNFYLSLNPGDNNVVESDAAMASFKFTMMNRYFVFKKKVKTNIIEPARVVGINHKINLGKVLTPYFTSNRMIIDPVYKSEKINKIYHAIRRKYPQYKPSVYLVRHTIPEDKLDHEVYRRNKFDFARIRDGTDDKTLLIYRAPDKFFYPIYYKKTDDDMERIDGNSKERAVYLLESSKIVQDLDMMVALTDKIAK